MNERKRALSERARIYSEPTRFNYFVPRADAVARDDECVKALEEALAQREKALNQAQLKR